MAKEKFLEQVRKRKQKRPPRKSKKPLKWLPPMAAERKYQRDLSRYLEVYIKELNSTLLPKLEDLWTEAVNNRRDVADPVRTDATWKEQLESILKRVKNSFEDKKPDEEKIAEEALNDANEYNRREFRKVVSSSVGVDVLTQDPQLRETVAKATKENVALIKSVPESLHEEVSDVVKEGLEKGRPVQSISKEIRERTDVAKSRADFLARDQIGKLNATLTAERQESIGVKKYIWRTARDDRVRERHADREGETFSWDSPPDGGHPGEDYQCFPGYYHFFSVSGVSKIFKHRYAGPVMHIAIENGCFIETTPNHPILTARGWIKACELASDDLVIEALYQEHGVILSHIRFADFFFTLSKLCGYRTTPIARSSFHKDAVAAFAEVIETGIAMPQEADSAFARRFFELIVAWGGVINGFTVDGVDKISPALNMCLQADPDIIDAVSKCLYLLNHDGGTELLLNGLKELKGGNGIVEYPAFYCWGEAIVSFAQAAMMAQRYKEFRTYLNRQVLQLISTVLNDVQIELNTRLPSADNLVEMASGRKSTDYTAFPITPHKIVSTYMSYYIGDLYNVETPRGYYSVHRNHSNMVVHNCRCYAEPILDDLL